MSLPTKPGNAERGWNDPPVIMHVPAGSAVNNSTPSKRTALNKRVAYPASGDVTMSNARSGENSYASTPPHGNTMCHDIRQGSPPSGVVLLPPSTSTQLPRFTAPIIVPTMNPVETSLPASGTAPTATNPITNTRVNIADAFNDDFGIPNFDDDTQMFHYTLSKLQKTLLDVQHRLQPKTVEIIRKKIEVLSSMWENGSISYEVKSTMARLSTALHKRRCDVAHDLHMSLMMDYVSEVGQWMVGVKRLIQEARDVEAPLSPTDTTIGQTSITSSNPLTLQPASETDQAILTQSSDAAGSPTESCDATGLPTESCDASGSPTESRDTAESLTEPSRDTQHDTSQNASLTDNEPISPDCADFNQTVASVTSRNDNVVGEMNAESADTEADDTSNTFTT